MTFTINTSTQKSLEKILNDNEIPYKITYNKKRYFDDEITKWGLPPFEDLDLTTENVIFKVSKELYDKVRDIIKPEKMSKGVWMHFNKKLDTKIEYKFLMQYKPRYPIYIISLNRYQIDRCYTIKHLEMMNVKYRLCVMTREVENYQKTIKDNKFENCIEIISIDDNNNLGGTPQRMKCWEHSVKLGYDKFWLLDDNIDGYYYYNRLQKIKIHNGIVFTALENFIDNVKEKVGIIGHNYAMDNPCTTMRNPFQINSKVYSSMLINTKILDEVNIKFRLKYNEDVDLVMQCLNNKIKTISLNIFLSNKKATLSVKGGNTDTIYDNGKKFQDKVDCLLEEWGDEYVQVITKHKDNRPHHKVDYDKFDLDKVITPIIKYSKRSYNDFGIELHDD